jgi:hypothetical protein
MSAADEVEAVDEVDESAPEGAEARLAQWRLTPGDDRRGYWGRMS